MESVLIKEVSLFPRSLIQWNLSIKDLRDKVILVRLREIADANSFAELLPQRNKEMGCEIEDTITASDGENVLFILDGWDELPSKAPAYSFILDLDISEHYPRSRQLHKDVCKSTSEMRTPGH